MDVLSSLPPFQYLVIYFLPVMWISGFVISLLSPDIITSLAKFPNPDTRYPHGVWFHMFIVRELVLGLVSSSLIAANEWRALTIVLACAGINGPCDMYLSHRAGASWRDAFMAHGVMTAVAYWAVWKLWEEHF
jgi:hypothetical protein